MARLALSPPEYVGLPVGSKPYRARLKALKTHKSRWQRQPPPQPLGFLTASIGGAWQGKEEMGREGQRKVA